MGAKSGRGRALLGGAQRGIGVELRDPRRLPAQLLERTVAPEILEQPQRDRRRDQPTEDDPEKEERGEPETE